MSNRFTQKLRGLRGKKGSLRARGASATLWSLGGIGMQRVLNLTSNLVMTRFLVPEDFGLMAVVITVLILVEMMSDIGIRQSIVRDPRGEDMYFLQVAWTVQIMRSAVITGLVLLIALGLWIFAPDGNSVYSHPQLPALIAVASLAIMFTGMESVALFVELRNLKQNVLVIIGLGTQVIALITMLVLVQINPSVWVLLIGLLLSHWVRLIWSHLAFRSKPMKLAWDREIAAELWTFGRWLIGSSMAGFVVNYGDRFLLGAMLPAETFGIYVIAALWLQAGLSSLSKTNQNVLYPALAEKLRNDRDGFLSAFLSIRRIVDVILISTFALVFVFGSMLIDLLYTPEYAMAGVFLTLLSARFMTQRADLLSMVLLAEGDSKQMMISLVISAMTMLITVLGMFRAFGVEAAVLAVAVAPAVGLLVLSAGLKRHHPEFSRRSDIITVVALLGFGLVMGLRS